MYLQQLAFSCPHRVAAFYSESLRCTLKFNFWWSFPEIWLVCLLVLVDDSTSYNTRTPQLANLLGHLLKTQHRCGHPYQLLQNRLHVFPLVASLSEVFRFSFIPPPLSLKKKSGEKERRSPVTFGRVIPTTWSWLGAYVACFAKLGWWVGGWMEQK